ncbi:MAG: histidinol-phosphate aminotransferase family protein [Clostridiaceae bacterium]|nr:histidinol-phosphate aminotransferase family protein [Clostridiaceae bacterium]
MIIMNRNTSPIKPLTDEQIFNAVKKTNYNQYPDQERINFINLYADYFGFNPDNIEVANGSDEWIQKLIITLGKNGVMSLNPDFVMYQIYTEQFLPEIYFVNAEPDFTFDFDKVIVAIKAKKPSLFLISNPQNPTGTMFSTQDLQRLADAMAEVDGYLGLDECYIDFAKDYERPKGKNIIILRTLSKVYGMAGLRVGMAIAEKETLDIITQINHPYPLNSLALNLASELFSDKKALQKFKNYQFESKARLETALDQVSDLMEIKESYTNYIFTYGDAAIDMANFLLDKGFLSRIYDVPILQNAARYSIIKLEEYQALNEAIIEWRNQYVE